MRTKVGFLRQLAIGPMRRSGRALLLVASVFGLGAIASPARADLTYTCDPGVAASTCSYLNTTIAGLYDHTFTNINADMYVTYGTTGLGSGEPLYNSLSYSTYVSDYAANAAASENPAQVSGLASLNTYDTPIYAGTNVWITGALGQALGISASSLVGFSSNGTAGCVLSSAGCYEDVITVTNDPTTPLYYRKGAPIASDAYDYYSVVEHETDEGLGTQSCITTQTTPLSNNCGGQGNESPNDLFRYQNTGQLVNLNVPDGSQPTTPGAYFSDNGGVTNGIAPQFFNTLDNGDDYADFDTTNNVCNGGTVPLAVQDAEGCPGVANLDIGGPEIAMLNGPGFDLPATIALAPEPMSLAILIPGVLGLIGLHNRKRSTARAA